MADIVPQNPHTIEHIAHKAPHTPEQFLHTKTNNIQHGAIDSLKEVAETAQVGPILSVLAVGAITWYAVKMIVTGKNSLPIGP